MRFPALRRFATKVFLILLLFNVALSAPGLALAHLDPPRPPAYQEVIRLISVSVADDMDGFASGELSLDYEVKQPRHNRVTGSIPATGYVSVSAPPLTTFPGTFPMVIYNHLNCTILERSFTIMMTLKDSDASGWDTSNLGLVIGGDQGQFGTANSEFGFAVDVQVVPRPEYSRLCADGEISEEEQPKVPEPPDKDKRYQIPPEHIEIVEEEEVSVGDAATQFAEKPRDIFHQKNSGLVAGLVIGIIVAFVLRGRNRRKK